MIKGTYKRAELIIPKISREKFLSLSPEKQKEYLRLYREQVTPKFEKWRKPHSVKCAFGGRGAGAKSESTASLLIQFAELKALDMYYNRPAEELIWLKKSEHKKLHQSIKAGATNDRK